MVTIMNISRHTAEDCPINNKDVLKLVVEAASDMEALAKRAWGQSRWNVGNARRALIYIRV